MIESALPNAQRSTKWNGPNYSIDGQDLITLGIPPKGGVRIVFHRGAKAKDTRRGERLLDDKSGRLSWATDQRASVVFTNPPEEQELKWIAKIAKQWVRKAASR